MITFVCPRCKRLQETNEEKAGAVVVCSFCGQGMKVPVTNPERTRLRQAAAASDPLRQLPSSGAGDQQKTATTAADSLQPTEDEVLEVLPLEDPDAIPNLVPNPPSVTTTSMSAGDMPEIPREIVQQLGDPISFYSPSRVWFTIYLSVGIGFLMLFLVVSCGSLISPKNQTRVVIPGFLVAIGLAFLFKAFHAYSKTQAVVCRDGLILMDRRTFYCRWNEIASIKYVISSVFMATSRGLSLTMIEDNVVKQWFPLATADFQAGKPVTIDKFVFDTRGIHYRNDDLSWKDVGGAEIGNDHVSVFGKGSVSRDDLLRIPIQRVVNAALVVALVNFAVPRTKGTGNGNVT